MGSAIKGPAIFLAQFVGEQAPFNSLPALCKWAAELGYKGIQLPADLGAKLIDLKKAAESKAYCEELQGVVAEAGLEITELPRRTKLLYSSKMVPRFDQDFTST